MNCRPPVGVVLLLVFEEICTLRERVVQRVRQNEIVVVYTVRCRSYLRLVRTAVGLASEFRRYCMESGNSHPTWPRKVCSPVPVSCLTTIEIPANRQKPKVSTILIASDHHLLGGQTGVTDRNLSNRAAERKGQRCPINVHCKNAQCLAYRRP